MLIHKQMIEVFRSVGAISKQREAGGLTYAFRGIDDVYNELHQHFADCGIYMLPEVLEDRSEERTNAKGTTLIYRILKVRYHFIAEDGSTVMAVGIGEGMDSGDKASNKAMSGAHKYILLQAFLIATKEDKDSENEHHEVTPKSKYSGQPQMQQSLKYSGQPQDKRALLNIFKDAGIEDSSLMKHLESKVLGMSFPQIKTFVESKMVNV